MTTMVVADTVAHAAAIGAMLAVPTGIAASPRSIQHYGAARGHHVDTILVDDSAWPLPDAALTELGHMLRRGARIVRRKEGQ